MITEHDRLRIVAVLDAVLPDYALGLHGIHGLAHWARVLTNGLALAKADARVDRDVVLLFALYHDCRRVDDGHDPEHGPRAATLAASHSGQVFQLDDAQLERLVTACRFHTSGRQHTDPTIGACWDSDRLDLGRLGTKPMASFLSTQSATDPLIYAAAHQRASSAWTPDWCEHWLRPRDA